MLVRLDGVKSAQVSRQATRQAGQGGTVLDWLPTVLNTNPLEIVVTGSQHHSHVVDVGVQVVEQVPVVDVSELVTGLNTVQ